MRKDKKRKKLAPVEQATAAPGESRGPYICPLCGSQIRVKRG